MLQATRAGDAALTSRVDTTDMKSAANSFISRHTDRLALHLLLVVAVLLLVGLPASAGAGLGIKTISPGNGQISGNVTWEVTVSSGNVSRVDFTIDGAAKWTENVAPWQYNGVAGGLNTTQLSDGTHQLTAKAFSKSGKAAGSSTVTVTVSNADGAAASSSAPASSASAAEPLVAANVVEPTVDLRYSGGRAEALRLDRNVVGHDPDGLLVWLGPLRQLRWELHSDLQAQRPLHIRAASTDAGSTIRVTVTASNSAGSATATSAATAVITQPPPSGPVTNLGASLPARMPESSGSRSIYVSTGGSDSNAGTLAAPVATLGKAFSLAQDGAIIYVRGGNYGVQMVNNRDFSAAQPGHGAELPRRDGHLHRAERLHQRRHRSRASPGSASAT